MRHHHHAMKLHIILSVLLLCLCTASLQAEPAASVSKPNIVILLADDLRPDGLASLGNPVVKTPNLDQFVSSGLIFRRAYVMGDFIQHKAGTKPVFLYIAGHEPHDPQYAPEELYSHCKPEEMLVPKAFAPFHLFDNGAIKVRDERTLPWPRTKEWLARKLARYCASTEYWDAEMGRVLDALRKAGQFDNTLFIIAGDNGLSLGEHGLLGKQNLYEFGGMHVPLVFAGKGIPKGETRTRLSRRGEEEGGQEAGRRHVGHAFLKLAESGGI